MHMLCSVQNIAFLTQAYTVRVYIIQYLLKYSDRINENLIDL